MRNFFEHSKSNWVKYSEYELKEKDGILYIKPTDDAMPNIYNIMENKEDIVVDSLNVGLLCMCKDKEKEAEQQAAVMGFISRYGLLGLIFLATLQSPLCLNPQSLLSKGVACVPALILSIF